MSTEVFDRTHVREVQIWITPQIDILRAMFNSPFGIPYLTLVIPWERSVYLQDLYIIQENETIKYDQLISLLVAELAKINSERTIVLADIVTKRLEESLKIEARRRKLNNKSFSNLIASELMDAQFDALREDQERLLTKIQIVDTARIKALAQIEELQSRILLEGGELLLAEIDVIKSQQDLTKKAIDILNAELRIAQIQLNVTEVLLDITNLSLEPMNIQSDIKMLDADIKRTELSEKHRLAEKEEIRIELDRITRVLVNDLNQVYDKEDYIRQDKTDINAYLIKLAVLLVTQKAAETAKMVSASADVINATTNAQSKVTSIATPEGTSRTGMATTKAAVSGSIATTSVQVNTARTLASQTENNAQINAAYTRAKADVASTLIHQIGGV